MENINKFVEYIESELSHASDNKISDKIQLYMRSLLQIPVSVYLRINHAQRVVFIVIEIEISDFIFQYNDDNEIVFLLEDDEHKTTYLDGIKIIDHQKFTNDLQKIFQSMKLDIFNGTITTIPSNRDISFILDIFDFEHVGFNFGKCSICHNATFTKTICNHYLCILCWSKLEIVDDENDYKQCPICRKIGLCSH